MGEVIFFALSVALAGAFAVVYSRQRKTIAELDRARARVQLEETRVFDFLHNLGDALANSTHPADLHQRIVEGVQRILNAQGGAIYLATESGELLQPQFVSPGFPPFCAVPAGVEAGAGQGNHVLHRFLSIHPLRRDEGAVGDVFTLRVPMLLRGEDPALALARASVRRTSSALLSPLLYGGKNLGVLAITRDEEAEPFRTAEFQIFKAVTEQSAFALSTALLFSDAAEKQRLDEDLQVAHEIQRILLPTSAPDVDGFQISGVNIPARQVSGDYYDYIPIDAERCGVAIADVSGKGVPASLIMAMCRSVLRSQALGQTSAAAVLRRVNELLFPDIKEDMFISMAYAIVERAHGTVTLCRAGHDAPLHYSAREHAVSRVNPPGMALGIDSGEVFNRVNADFSLKLEPDDCLIFYTDGVTEALDGNGEEFGMENLTRAVLASASEGAAGMIARLTDELRNFIGVHPQHDDITLIVIRKKP